MNYVHHCYVQMPAIARLIVLGLIVCCTSCAIGPRTIIVPETIPVQLAEDVHAYVYVETPSGRVRSANRVRLYEGQWVLTDTEGGLR